MSWPDLTLERWQPTYATLHRCTQMVGKIQLALTPRTNHFWNVAFHLTARGLTTPPMPHGERTFDIAFDFVDHEVVIRTRDGDVRALALVDRPVADFERDLFAALDALALPVTIDDRPVEIVTEAIPFHDDRVHATYHAPDAERFWHALSSSAVVFEELRARFIGKHSPVHFFWGSFDLASSRYSGRRAPTPPDANAILREAYSHEVISAGFWPGDARFPAPAYYAYAVPTPTGLPTAPIAPDAAFWHAPLGEFLLPYDAVRQAPDPRRLLLEFLQSTYDAAADRLGWDRAALERQPPAPAPPPEVQPPAP